MTEPSPRSREQALRLSLDVARELAAEPERFAQLAARHSGDVTSRDFGGELGVIAIAGLPPTMLDALAALKRGAVSRVIETTFGFHVIKNLPMAPERTITARRILISHREAPLRTEQTKLPRTREEAFALAKALHGELRAHPERFADLARKHSDAIDAAEGGDIGSASTYEGAERALGFRLIAQHEVGFVSPPFETPIGIEIYQRAEDRERKPMLVRFFSIDPSTVAGDPTAQRTSSMDIAALAKHTASELAAHPERFDDEQQRYCVAVSDCSRQHWTLERGRNEASTVKMVEQLGFGHVAPEPLAVDGGFLILRREDPSHFGVEEERYETAIPEVEFAAFDQQLGQLDAAALSQGALQLLQAAEHKLRLNAEQRTAFRALFEDLARQLASVPADRRAELIARHQAKVLALVGPEKMDLLRQLREEQWRKAQMM